MLAVFIGVCSDEVFQEHVDCYHGGKERSNEEREDQVRNVVHGLGLLYRLACVDDHVKADENDAVAERNAEAAHRSLEIGIAPATLGPRRHASDGAALPRLQIVEKSVCHF